MRALSTMSSVFARLRAERFLTQQLLAPTFAARGLMARSVRDLGRLFLVQSGYNDLGACAMREDLRRDAKPGRRVFEDSRVAWFGDLGGE